MKCSKIKNPLAGFAIEEIHCDGLKLGKIMVLIPRNKNLVETSNNLEIARQEH